jgi:hypothetical protein
MVGRVRAIETMRINQFLLLGWDEQSWAEGRYVRSLDNCHGDIARGGMIFEWKIREKRAENSG